MNEPRTADFTPELLTVADIVAITRLGRSSIYKLLLSGELPSLHIGRSRRVRRVDLDRWLERVASGDWYAD